MASEFDLIARYFAPLAGPEGLGLKDDAALMTPDPGQDLVITTDANVAGRHFLPDEAPGVVARRLLRTNLSDLAAKGARPFGYLLTLALPAEADEAWIAAFAAGLAQDQETYGIDLLGGDTVGTDGPIVASIAAIGTVSTGRMIRRSGAEPGDAVFVTGAIGDGCFGLEALQGGLQELEHADREYLIDRFRLPDPPMAFGAALSAAGLAHAAADVSDGLLADLGHIANASGVSMNVRVADAPLSKAGAAIVAAAPARLGDALTGGDDYQIIFTAAAGEVPAIRALANGLGVAVTEIGQAVDAEEEAPAVTALDAEGIPLSFDRHGYRHR